VKHACFYRFPTRQEQENGGVWDGGAVEGGFYGGWSNGWRHVGAGVGGNWEQPGRQAILVLTTYRRAKKIRLLIIVAVIYSTITLFVCAYQPIIQQYFSLTTNHHQSVRNHPANRVNRATRRTREP
jgi:hypothetical protein